MTIKGVPALALVAAATAVLYEPVDSTKYTYLGTGGCRGNGGPTDKVNGRDTPNLDQAGCESACNDEATCVGYSHKVGGYCTIYGPGLHGSCPDATRVLETTCGTCSDAGAADSVSCTNTGGTWTDGGWSDPEVPWTGDGHATTHVHTAHTPASGEDFDYPCFDHNDFLDDHLAKCTGTASASSTNPNEDCATVFGAADDYLEASCPDGCTYTAAPAFVSKPPHGPDMKFVGWNAAMPGACRSSCGPGGTVAGYAATCDEESQIRPGTKWCKSCGVNPARMTQYECMMACEVEPSCIGYHHGPWCSVYGPGPELWNKTHPGFNTNIPAGQNAAWGGASYPDDTGDVEHAIDTTKSNSQYICITPCDTGVNDDGHHSLHTTTHAACTVPSARYHLVGEGGCRGNGGSLDLVNYKYANGFIESACEAECNSEADCVGFMYQNESPYWCNIYGPGIAGSCPLYPNLKTQEACENNGVCSNTLKLTENTCGGCSVSAGVVPNKITCENVDGTWVALAWTAQPGLWEGPDMTDIPWEFESHATTHIHSSAPTAGYKCYDIVTDDHIAQCHGADSHADATWWDTDCHHYFSSFDTYEQENCPAGCVFVAAPTMEKVIIPHPPDIKLPGWMPAMSGACRQEVTNGGEVIQKFPNGKWSKTAGNPANKDPIYGGMTQAECAAACVAEPTCIAYHHGTWCSVFGKDIHITPDSAGTTGWGFTESRYITGDVGTGAVVGEQVITVDTTKPNEAYMCVMIAEDHPARVRGSTAAIACATEFATKDAALVSADTALSSANTMCETARSSAETACEVTITTKDAALASAEIALSSAEAACEVAIANKEIDRTLAESACTASLATQNVKMQDATAALLAEERGKDKGVEEGTVAGIAVGCFFAGIVLGVLVISLILCPAAKRSASITKSTTAGVAVQKIDQMSVA